MFDRHYQNQTDILITKMRPDPRRPKRCKGVINAALEVVHVFPNMCGKTRWRSLRGASRDGWQLTVGPSFSADDRMPAQHRHSTRRKTDCEPNHEGAGVGASEIGGCPEPARPSAQVLRPC
jgi:hypothetical protein